MVNGSIATIESYQNIVRRQVKGKGHEIMLKNIADFHVKQEGALYYDSSEGLRGTSIYAKVLSIF